VKLLQNGLQKTLVHSGTTHQRAPLSVRVTVSSSSEGALGVVGAVATAGGANGGGCGVSRGGVGVGRVGMSVWLSVLVSSLATGQASHKLKMFTGPHTEGPHAWGAPGTL